MIDCGVVENVIFCWEEWKYRAQKPTPFTWENDYYDDGGVVIKEQYLILKVKLIVVQIYADFKNICKKRFSILGKL